MAEAGMSTHRFVVVVEVDESKRVADGRLDTPDTWDHIDLAEAMREAVAVIVEVDDHEMFED